MLTFAFANRSIAAFIRRGKSGQHRVTYFLTGRRLKGFSSRAENNRFDVGRSKGEKVR